MSGKTPEIARTVAALRTHVAAWREAGESVAVVPTMGALHAGHLALVEAAMRDCDRTIVTIFVNPTQFGENEDLDAYPRSETEDLAKLAELGADLAFIPATSEMYPHGFSTQVAVSELTEGLCGHGRPAHFSGVATVVSKLFIQAQADRAYFGEKDYQQCLVVRRMARDLDIPTEVVAVPTVREADGLALSSRNAYLDAAQRAAAPALHRVLTEVAKRVAGGAAVAEVVDWGRAELEAAGFDKVDYLDVCDGLTLESLATVGVAAATGRPARAFAAAYLGATRLIDNVEVG